MLLLQEMIEKFLLLRESPSTTSPLNPNTISNVRPSGDSVPKVSIERWNQINLGYFDSHLNKAYGEGEIVLVEKSYTTETLYSLYNIFRAL